MNDDRAATGFGGSLGSGGHYYFTFRAQGTGRTTITLHDGVPAHGGGKFAGGSDRSERQFTVDVR
ncbi:hypothetical protein ACIRD3_17415 [Kitasatospora sp. NPDC093550]|uniref:hypothetical protein n=1 Tax=Kitasatospora sp. NPDC093550 TaxID=3364089 RepID=UPI00380558C4